MNLLKAERFKIEKTRLKSYIKGCYGVFLRSKSFNIIHLNLFKGCFLSHTFGTSTFQKPKLEVCYKSTSYNLKRTILGRFFNDYYIDNQLVILNKQKYKRSVF